MLNALYSQNKDHRHQITLYTHHTQSRLFREYISVIFKYILIEYHPCTLRRFEKTRKKNSKKQRIDMRDQ